VKREKLRLMSAKIHIPFFDGRLDEMIPANFDLPLRATKELPRPSSMKTKQARIE
tara:strand:+ start:873 stop:1037 length:165 start_codon:yes stop_codon:yes gene_type:complete